MSRDGFVRFAEGNTNQWLVIGTLYGSQHEKCQGNRCGSVRPSDPQPKWSKAFNVCVTGAPPASTSRRPAAASITPMRVTGVALA